MDGWEWFWKAMALVGLMSGAIATLAIYIFQAAKADLKELEGKHDTLVITVNTNYKDLKDSAHEFRNELPKMHPTRFEFSQEIKKMDRNMADIKSTISEVKSAIKEEGKKTVDIITQRLDDLGVTKKH